MEALVRFSDLPGRRTLRSADTNRLVVPPVRLTKVDSRVFPVSGLRTIRRHCRFYGAI